MDNELPYPLTTEENDAFKELKRRIHKDYGDEVADDSRIYRFLKARRFNVKLAEDMLKENIRWRQAENIDTIIEDFEVPEVLKKFYPLYILGYDKEGAPVTVVELNGIDVKGLSKCVSKETVYRFGIHRLEVQERCLTESSKKLGKVVDSWISILDFANLSIPKVTNKLFIDIMLTMISTYEKHYPERSKYSYVINATPAFTFLFNISKPLIAPETLAKLKVFGTNGWQEEFKQIMGEDLLHLFIHGYSPDTDKELSPVTPIVRGGAIPEKYYHKNSTKCLKFKDNISEYILKSNDAFRVQVNISIPCSILEWEFETESNDIKFGLSYQENNKTLVKTIIPLQKINTDFCPSTGQHFCKEVGVYILIFDNTYSWIRQKHLYYRYSVKNSDENSLKNND